MHYTKYTFTQFVERSHRILYLTQENSHIKERLHKYGYSDNRLEEGGKYHEALNAIHRKLHNAGCDKMECVRQKNIQQRRVSRVYMKYLKLARIVFDQDQEAEVALVLKGQRERVYEKWIHQVRLFCNNILKIPRLTDQMNELGVTRADLLELKTELDKLQELSDSCRRLKAEYRKIVAEKNVRVRKWQDWLSDYVKVVRIATQDSPEVSQRWINRILSKGE